MLVVTEEDLDVVDVVVAELDDRVEDGDSDVVEEEEGELVDEGFDVVIAADKLVDELEDKAC